MDSHVVRQINEKVGGWFTGYKTEKVSNHLQHVQIGKKKILVSFKKFLGFTYAKKYDISIIEIEFSETLEFRRSFRNIHHGIVREEYIVECAVDETTKSVFWKAELTSRTFSN